MSDENKETTDEILPIDKHGFYFETPLYEYVEKKRFRLLNPLSGEVDAYSVRYDSPTTYEITSHKVAESYYSQFEGYQRVSLHNKRKNDDVLIYFVIHFEDGFMKVGQMPSLADLQNTQITRKYSSQLSKGELALFKKAIGLAAHGVGAGSFVYLRKIFENLINEAYQSHKDSIELVEADFKKLWMAEKVETLSDFLPSQLVEMKSIYSILSKGVHELSEKDCLLYFQPIQLSIELILEQKIEQQAKADRDKAVKDQLKIINQQISK